MDDLYNHGARTMANSFEEPNPFRGSFPPPPPASPAPPTGRAHGGVRAVVAGGLVAAVVAGGVGFAAGRLGSDSTTVRRTSVVQSAPEALTGQALDLRTLLERVTPSVVSIQLGQANGDQVVPFAAGSGVVISSDGLVLTNAHVVEGADVIQVQLSDKRTIRADLVGTSPSHD